jgi:hypothetical protein
MVEVIKSYDWFTNKVRNSKSLQKEFKEQFIKVKRACRKYSGNSWYYDIPKKDNQLVIRFDRNNKEIYDTLFYIRNNKGTTVCVTQDFIDIPLNVDNQNINKKYEDIFNYYIWQDSKFIIENYVYDMFIKSLQEGNDRLIVIFHLKDILSISMKRFIDYLERKECDKEMIDKAKELKDEIKMIDRLTKV